MWICQCQKTPLSGWSLHTILNVSVLDWMWLVEFLQNNLHSDHLAQPWGTAVRDNNSWRAAGVTVHGWGKRSNGWGGFIVSNCWSRRRQKAKTDRGERVNNAVCHGKTERIGECGIVWRACTQILVSQSSVNPSVMYRLNLDVHC